MRIIVLLTTACALLFAAELWLAREAHAQG